MHFTTSSTLTERNAQKFRVDCGTANFQKKKKEKKKKIEVSQANSKTKFYTFQNYWEKQKEKSNQIYNVCTYQIKR